MEYTISEMAAMHGITKQTLIYYNRIGLFYPARIGEHGERFYTSEQMPILREICSLRRLDIPLKEIHALIKAKNPAFYADHLEEQLKIVKQRENELHMMHAYLEERIHLYRQFQRQECLDTSIQIKHFSDRYALISKWKYRCMNSAELHLCYVDGIKRLNKYGLHSPYGMAAQIDITQLFRQDHLDDIPDSGSIFFIPFELTDDADIIKIPEGDYYCSYVYGMPYNMAPIAAFVSTLMREGHRFKGHVISVCLLDGLFHDDHIKEDFCELQIMKS